MTPDELMAFASKTNAHSAAEMAGKIKAVVHEYDGKMPLALAVGVLNIVARELLDDDTLTE